MRTLFFICSLFAFGCSAKYNTKVDFNANEPLRVAVLPFVQVDHKGEIVEGRADLALDNVGIVSEKLEEPPAQFVRKVVQGELGKSSLDVFPATLIDSELSHHGFADADLKVDLKKVLAADPKIICSHLVSCDAVMYGTLRKWDRSYYGIQSVNTVALDLKLVSVKDGRVLFSASAEDSDSRGIGKGPTGFSDLIIEPIRGLDNEIITDLSRKVVTRMLLPLRAENRPEYLESSPPAIYAAAHDAQAGTIRKDGRLTVLAFGSPGMSATFSIGNVVQNIPMVELDDTHYSGEYYPLPSDSFSAQTVSVALTDDYGREAKEELRNGPVTLAR